VVDRDFGGFVLAGSMLVLRGVCLEVGAMFGEVWCGLERCWVSCASCGGLFEGIVLLCGVGSAFVPVSCCLES